MTRLMQSDERSPLDGQSLVESYGALLAPMLPKLSDNPFARQHEDLDRTSALFTHLAALSAQLDQASGA